MCKDNTRVLVVDDELIIAHQVCQFLKLFGYHPLTPVTSGSEAIKVVQEQQPDIIFIDISLVGEMNGIQAALKIRQFHDVPIVFITGYSGSEIVNRAQQANPAAILEKPIHAEQIRAVVEQIVKRGEC